MNQMLLLALFFVSALSISQGQTNFDYGPIRADKLKRPYTSSFYDDFITARITMKSEIVKINLKVSAYFYGPDNKLLYSSAGHVRGLTEGETPSSYLYPNKKYLAVVQEQPQKAKKWRHVVLVIGMPGDLWARVYPNDDLAKYSFPEKDSVSVAR
ncbi:MAG TPA: hypothetical protein DIT13_00080 [Verrucomicrobiales bacterium]|nr:hypothetical protein [Verrucomicrobiales bacterium]HRJ11186.1 hypothetical protein [Prosthecobacter sp.]